MKPKHRLSRRAALKTITAGSASLAVFATPAPAQPAIAPRKPDAPAHWPNHGKEIWSRVFEAPLIDTHEHLVDESFRLNGPKPRLVPCDDWAILLSHYFNSDLGVAGMPKNDHDRFLSPGVDPLEKWRLLAPWWPAVKNTGYGQAVRIAMRELYAVEDLSAATVAKVQEGYEKVRRPGFYNHVLRTMAGIESCQVNSLAGEPFRQSELPQLLMQDISIVGMFVGPNIGQYAKPAGIEVRDLSDWHRVIKWWFDRYAKFAVAAKSQNAYNRNIDYGRVRAEDASRVFSKLIAKDRVMPEERKLLEDHLFWYAVDMATSHSLPVKLHTGYYAGQNSMPLSRLQQNVSSACDLCRLSPETQFVFMHIAYPYYEEMLALTKQWSNAHVDMCWAWIINPIAAKDYLKKHIVTAPINKLLPFGGDYIPVEPVLGHATMARRGIAQALTELVEEGWLTLSDALEIVNPLMHGNARRLFALSQKADALKTADWAQR